MQTQKRHWKSLSRQQIVNLLQKMNTKNEHKWKYNYLGNDKQSCLSIILPCKIINEFYRGCGCGWIEINKNTGEIVDLRYGINGYLEYGSNEQNCNLMKPNQKSYSITQKYDSDYVRMFGNFSCTEFIYESKEDSKNLLNLSKNRRI